MKNRTTYVNGSRMNPIPELFRPDGQVQVVFLAGNGIQFFAQSEDAWYRATVPGNVISDGFHTGTRTVYWPEEAASPLGCVAQFQFCNTALAPDKRCGPLASWDDAVFESAPLFNTTGLELFEGDDFPTSQIASRFIWLLTILNNAATNLAELLETLGTESLVSKASLMQGLMGPLPPNQWQLDVTHWWSTYLASVQAAFVETAMGPADPTGELEQYTVVPWNDHIRYLCNNQVCNIIQSRFLTRQIEPSIHISYPPSAQLCYSLRFEHTQSGLADFWRTRKS